MGVEGQPLGSLSCWRPRALSATPATTGPLWDKEVVSWGRTRMTRLLPGRRRRGHFAVDGHPVGGIGEVDRVEVTDLPRRRRPNASTPPRGRARLFPPRPPRLTTMDNMAATIAARTRGVASTATALE